MVASCCAYGCTNRQKPDSSLSFHTFPLNDEVRLKEWVVAVRRKDFKPTKASVLCSAHFKKEDFLLRPGAYKARLSPTAVPSIFPAFPIYYQTKVKKPRTSRVITLPLLQEEAVAGPSNEGVLEALAGPSHVDPLEVVQSIASRTRDVEVQCSIIRPVIIKHLRAKVKALRKKVVRRNSKIKSMEHLLLDLKNKGMLNADLEYVIKENFQGTTKELFLNVNKNQRRSSQGQRYSMETKKFALTLHYHSPKAYKYCRKILNLPHPSSLTNWVSNVKCEPGFLEHVFSRLATFPNKDCNLVLDSMAIRKQIIWSVAENRYVGFCDLGNITINNDSPATEALVFMLVSLKEYWKLPVGYFLVNKITASMQKNLIETAIKLAVQSGLRVHGVTFDGAATNIATMQSLGCNIFGDLQAIKPDFKIDTNILYAIPDACHMIKLARNCFADLQVLKSPDGIIDWTYITRLFDMQNELGLKLGNKISKSHVQWYMNKMKVKLAAQTLSASTASALEFLGKSGVPEFQGVEETTKFIRIIDEIFDFLNSSNPFLTGSKRAIFKENIDEMEKKLNDHLTYLYSLTTCEDILLHQGQRKTFIVGFAMGIKSIISIARNLLFNSMLSFKYVLTYKFSQDYLELFFSKIRQRHGFNNNPNSLQFKWALKQILLKNEISPSSAANSSLIQNDPSGNIFEIEWRRSRKDILPESEAEDDNDHDEIDLNLINSDQNIIEDNILYYIAGFIVRKTIAIISCPACRESLIINCENEHNYCSIGEFSNLVSLKNRGGLIRVSKDVFQVLKICNGYLRVLTGNFKNVSSIDNKLIMSIIIKTKNALAHKPLFPTCTEVSDLRSHKLELVALISHHFLKIRMFSMGKLKTEESNPTSKRHYYNKLVLFKHQ